MGYGVGIDLGTSFTAAAVGDARGVRVVALGPEVVVPSVAYPAPDGSVLTGPAALAAAGDPAAVARGFKRRLGDPTPLLLRGAAYSPAALMAAQLRDVLAAVTRTQGGPPSSIVLTCPAIWGQYRREQFAEVPRLAGVTDHHLVTEPEAAATHYAAERRLGDGEVVAVHDLGGGTFDSTVLRMRSGELEILGTPEGVEHLGGVDFDEALLTHLDGRLGGAVGALAPGARATVLRACVRAKEALSTEPDVTVAVPLPSGTREVTVTRLEFNELIRPSLRQTADAVRRTVASAGLRPEDLSAVLLAGGSSRIPLVGQLVAEEFGTPVRGTPHPKFVVALGAAALATRLGAAAEPSDARPAGPVPPAVPPPAPVPVPRRRWLVPALAAAVVAGVATPLVLTGGAPAENHVTAAPNTSVTSGTTGATTSGSTDAAGTSPLRLLDAGTVNPSWVGLVSSEENWDGTKITSAGAHQGPISATWNGAGGLRVTWRDAPGELYLLTSKDPRDLASYVDGGGTLVFDLTVHEPPAGDTTVAAFCGYPCGGEVVVTNLFRGLPPEQPTTIRIPLSCFTAAGLDPTKVDTPFVVHTEEPFDATFADVRWEPGAATAPAATPCDTLR